MVKRKHNTGADLAPPRRVYIGLLAAVLLLYVCLPQLKAFEQTFSVLGRVQLSWLCAAVLFALASFVCAAFTYYVLLREKVSYGTILVVQIANGFAGKLLPLGVGGIGLNVVFIEHKVRSYASAAATVTTNNVLGFVGNMLLFVAALILAHKAITLPGGHHLLWFGVLAGVALVTAALLYHAKLSVRRQLLAYARSLLATASHPWRLSEALLSSILLTGCFAAAFWFCCRALGMQVGAAESFVIFTFGMAVASGTPTPGGIGGAEAALTAGLVASGQSAADSLAAALLFRAVTYWLPMVVGYAAFQSIYGQLSGHVVKNRKKGHNTHHV